MIKSRIRSFVVAVAVTLITGFFVTAVLSALFLFHVPIASVVVYGLLGIVICGAIIWILWEVVK